MKLLKIFVIGLLFSATPAMSSIMGGAGDMEYKIVTLTTELKETLEKNPEVKVCGKYFAKIETQRQDVVLFGFEKKSLGNLPAAALFAFTHAEAVSVASINEKAASPTVTVLGDERHMRFRLRMNMEDYKAGLPCFSKGTDI